MADELLEAARFLASRCAKVARHYPDGENVYREVATLVPQLVTEVERLTVADWTMDGDGRSNASLEYLELVRAVERLIRSEAHTLIAGQADVTARLIVSQLAHVHGLAPVAGRRGEKA